ncbi:Superoxide-generating NADPH oxidase heavy chain subunit B [Hordeum vulgare]|nr:Superoxide-generating NADPH oxidase heavy chain subunit B [Hordeum vulgare]
MKAAWNPAQVVVWRRINANLFSIQFNCLADWNKAMHQGPWDFRGMALIMAEYDGFTNSEKIKLDRLETWCQIHRLPDGVLKSKNALQNLASRIGMVEEVQVALTNGFIGEFIRVRVKLDVNKKLTRAVGITKGGEREKYLVKYEKIPTFCNACGLMGHWHEECGSGEHDQSKFEWGSFLMAPRRGRGGGRGGRGPAERERGGEDDPAGRGKGVGRGMGRGWGNNVQYHPTNPSNSGENPMIWRHTYVQKDRNENEGANGDGMVPATSNQHVRMLPATENVLGKWAAEDSNSADPSVGKINVITDPKTAIIPFTENKLDESPEEATFAEKVNRFEGEIDVEENEGSGSTAGILRDEKGGFIAGFCRFIPFTADVVTIEAMAMRDGLHLVNSLGFNRVEAESDSLSVIKCCQGQDQWWDAAAAVFAECIDMATSIGKVIFSHCFREANSVAHELAKFSFCNKVEDNWTNEPPEFLVSQLVNDVLII